MNEAKERERGVSTVSTISTKSCSHQPASSSHPVCSLQSASASASAFPPHLTSSSLLLSSSTWTLCHLISSHLVSFLPCLVPKSHQPATNRLGGRRSLANEPRAPSACIRVIRVAFNFLAPAHLNTATATTNPRNQPPIPPASRALHCALCIVHTHTRTPNKVALCACLRHSNTRPPLWRPSRPPSQLLLLSRLTTTSSLWPPMATSQPPGRPPRILISSPWACLSLVCAPHSLPVSGCVGVCVCLSVALSLAPSTGLHSSHIFRLCFVFRPD